MTSHTAARCRRDAGHGRAPADRALPRGVRAVRRLDGSARVCWLQGQDADIAEHLPNSFQLTPMSNPHARLSTDAAASPQGWIRNSTHRRRRGICSSRCASMTLAGRLLVVERIGSPTGEFGVAQHVRASSRCLWNLVGPTTAPRLTAGSLSGNCRVSAADAGQAEARLLTRRVPR